MHGAYLLTVVTASYATAGVCVLVLHAGALFKARQVIVKP